MFERESVRVISSLALKAGCFQKRDGKVPVTAGAEKAAERVRLPHMPGLDGLRALAVLCVLLYHAGPGVLPGGFLGVEVFFVISGFLITSLLLAEFNGTGRIDLKAFWLSRARRLLPALFLMLAGVVAFAAVFLPAEVAGLRGDFCSAVAYVNNWYQIYAHKSYFETVGRPPLLRHLWSLAVEEQFYVVWPVVFSLLMLLRRSGWAMFAVLGGAVASAVWMAALYQPDVDPSRLYYGTDTRVGGILIGAALAFAMQRGKAVGGVRSRVLDAAGLGALGALAACMVVVNEYQAFLYRGGFAVVGLLTAVLIAAVARGQSSHVARVLGAGLLRWVGVRSYGIYLWHFPVFMVTRPELDLASGGWQVLALRLVVTFVIAAVSYRFVEMPIRQGRFRGALQGGELLPALRLAAGTVSLLFAVSTLGMILVRAESARPPEYLAEAPMICVQTQMPVAVLQQVQATGEVAVAEVSSSNLFTAIGDSVMLGVGDELKVALNDSVVVDAERGRLPAGIPEIIRRLRAESRLNPTVILHIGDNGPFTERMFDKIMLELADVEQVLVVNLKVPRNWEGPNNAMLAAAVKRYKNAVLVDWHGASAKRRELFWKDGLHLRPAGAKFYAGLIAQAVFGEEQEEVAGEAVKVASNDSAGRIVLARAKN